MWGRPPAALVAALTAAAAQAQLAISANDAKVKLVDGKVTVEKDPQPDTLTFIDLRTSPPKVVAEIDAPNSVVGPPTGVAISPQADIALVTSSMRIDPADPTKQVPDDRLTVIDLTSLKPTLASRLRSAIGAAPNAGRQLNPRSSPRCRRAKAPPASPSTRPAPWRWSPIAPRAPCPSSRSAARRWRRPARSPSARTSPGPATWCLRPTARVRW